MKGWIKLHRQIIDNAMYFSEPFDRTHAWIDLLLMASSCNKDYWSKGQVVNLKPGQFVTSAKFLADRWKWSEGKVKRFIKQLKKLEMCSTDGTALGTTVTIVKWDLYQDRRPTYEPSDEPADGLSHGPSDEPSDGPLSRSIKNNKESKEGGEASRQQRTPEEEAAIMARWREQMKERCLNEQSRF